MLTVVLTPAPYLDDGDVRLLHGDCRTVMRELAADSVDAIVTDPPYGLEFMGKDWDRLGGSFTEPRGGGDWAAKHGTTRKGFDGYGPLPTYVGGGNIKCPDCGSPVDGRDPEQPDPRKGYRCTCGGALRERNRQAARAMQDWHETWAREALRIAKPGAHLVAFGGTRTVHRLTCALEDAGWEIRDTLTWLYGSGFPKSLDVAKAIDKAARGAPEPASSLVEAMVRSELGEPAEPSMTAEAMEWQGWGTALKPAHEPIILARKPLTSTVARNVLQHGTGALNIDGCRIGGPTGHGGGQNGSSGFVEGNEKGSGFTPSTTGRWPANVVLTCACTTPEAHDADCPVRILDGQSGDVGNNGQTQYPSGTKFNNVYAPFESHTLPGRPKDNIGGASRFFYTAKASRSERNDGLHDQPAEHVRRMSGGEYAHNSGSTGSSKNGAHSANHHPTVKPVHLMRWLTLLITPPGGLILDPFIGSGTTAVAARAEGFRTIGIDQDETYLRIAAGRLSQQSLLGGHA